MVKKIQRTNKLKSKLTKLDRKITKPNKSASKMKIQREIKKGSKSKNSKIGVTKNTPKLSKSKSYKIKETPNVCIIDTSHMKIPKKFETVTKDNLLSALLYPLSIDDFKLNYYRKKALLIKSKNIKRMNEMIENDLYGLNLEMMCENTASDKIHIWFPDRSNNQTKTIKQKEIDSFGTDEIPLALKAYDRGNASLYFGSPVEFREKYCKQLGYQLGMNFSAYYPDFSSMSEVEVFVSKEGGYTDYHMDFQENFTVQLDGVKTWNL